MQKNLKLSHAEARRLFDYDPVSGALTWRVSVSWRVKAGDRAGSSFDAGGYRLVMFRRVTYREHRLIWFWVTGSWPAEEVDHKDRDKQNNAWENLREASAAQNRQNVGLRKHNTSGTTGVSLHPSGKWAAYINVNGGRIALGVFEVKHQAVDARRAAEVRWHTHSPLREAA